MPRKSAVTRRAGPPSAETLHRSSSVMKDDRVPCDRRRPQIAERGLRSHEATLTPSGSGYASQLWARAPARGPDRPAQVRSLCLVGQPERQFCLPFAHVRLLAGVGSGQYFQPAAPPFTAIPG